MDYGLSETEIVDYRMCKDFLVENNIDKEENNMNNTNNIQQDLPEKVVEMYTMLLGISSEIERIKYELAKRNKNMNRTSNGSRFSFENLAEPEFLGNGIPYSNGTTLHMAEEKDTNHEGENGKSTILNNMHLQVPDEDHGR